MESETVLSEPSQPELIVPQIVEDKSQANMVEASETPVNLVDLTKQEMVQPTDTGQHNAADDPAHGTSDTVTHTKDTCDQLEVQQNEVADTASSDGCEQSEASVVSVIKVESEQVKPNSAELVHEPPSHVPVENHVSGHEEQGKNTQEAQSLHTPSANGQENGVSLATLAQRASPECANSQAISEKHELVVTTKLEEEGTSTGSHETTDIVPENQMQIETNKEKEEDLFAVQQGLPVSSAGNVKVEPVEYILPKAGEIGKATVPSVTIDPVSGEEISAAAVESEVVTDTKLENNLEAKKAVSTSSLDKPAEPKRQKRRRFHFSFHRAKENEPKNLRKADSLDRTSQRPFGTNVKHVWENLSKSLKRKEKPAQEAIKPKTRPPRPPPVAHRFEGKTHGHGNELDQQSLQSMSAVSISNSPVVARKHLIQEALPDFIEALPTDSMEVTAEYNYKANHTGDIHAQQQERVLSWTAAQIAETSANEVPIQPTQKRPPKGHASPKPPRPTSPPSLSPLDYQPYHSEDGMSQSDIVQRRLNLVQAMTPPGSEVNVQVRGSATVARSPSSQVSGLNRPVTTSLDRQQEMVIDYRTAPNVRRAQTLRPDYANRLRERVLSLRVEPGETQAEGGTLRPRKLKQKKETYVCSDTIKFPKLSFKLGRKQKDKSPAVVRSDKTDLVIPRPQPNFVCSAPDDKRIWVQQQITTSYEPEICKMEGYVASHPPTTFTPQLTSLPSMAGHVYGKEKQQVISMDSNAPEYDLTKVCYISGELRGQLDQASECEQIQQVLKMIQPFLVSWDSQEDQTAEKSAAALTNTVDCIRSFLNTCVRLRSADLQGHFAPFQYQLASFGPFFWKNLANFSHWNNLLVVGGAYGTTEYLQLVPPKATKPEMYCAHRCVDVLLTNWLDRHHSTPQMINGSSKPISQAIYQPVSFVSNLAKLLKVNPFQNPHLTTFLNLGIRLAVLLTYESCLTELRSCGATEHLTPVTKLEEIILGWSTSNCLTLFRLEEKCPNSPTVQPRSEDNDKEGAGNKEDGTGSDVDMQAEESVDKSPVVDDLVKALCPTYMSIESAIDGLIDELFETATQKLDPTGIGSCLLKSVAPADWTAMIVARIAMHKL